MIDITWIGIVENYLEDGNIKPLAEKVRTSDIPAEYRNQVADILLGKLTHKKQHRNSHLMRVYMKILTNGKLQNRMIDDLNKQLKIWGSTSKPIPKMTQQTLKRMISLSKDFRYSENYDTSPYETTRRVINRMVKENGLETLPDYIKRDKLQ